VVPEPDPGQPHRQHDHDDHRPDDQPAAQVTPPEHHQVGGETEHDGGVEGVTRRKRRRGLERGHRQSHRRPGPTAEVLAEHGDQHRPGGRDAYEQDRQPRPALQREDRDDDDRDHGHPDGSAQVGEVGDPRLARRGTRADGGVEHGLVERRQAFAVDDRLVDLRRQHRGPEHDDAADDHRDDQRQVGQAPVPPPGEQGDDACHERDEPAARARGPLGQVTVSDLLLVRHGRGRHTAFNQRTTRPGPA